MDAFGWQLRMSKKRFTKVSQIPVLMSGWRYPFVNLDHLNGTPRHVAGSECLQHLSWCVGAADCHHEPTAGCQTRFGCCRNDGRGSLGDIVSGV
jgi:hypothetical protein